MLTWKEPYIAILEGKIFALYNNITGLLSPKFFSEETTLIY